MEACATSLSSPRKYHCYRASLSAVCTYSTGSRILGSYHGAPLYSLHFPFRRSWIECSSIAEARFMDIADVRSRHSRAGARIRFAHLCSAFRRWKWHDPSFRNFRLRSVHSLLDRVTWKHRHAYIFHTGCCLNPMTTISLSCPRSRTIKIDYSIKNAFFNLRFLQDE